MVISSKFEGGRPAVSFDRVELEDESLVHPFELSRKDDLDGAGISTLTWVYDRIEDAVLWSAPVETLFGFAPGVRGFAINGAPSVDVPSEEGSEHAGPIGPDGGEDGGQDLEAEVGRIGVVEVELRAHGAGVVAAVPGRVVDGRRAVDGKPPDTGGEPEQGLHGCGPQDGVLDPVVHPGEGADAGTLEIDLPGEFERVEERIVLELDPVERNRGSTTFELARNDHRP